MNKKLTDIEMLKYWIDTEFTILHIMFAIIMLQLVSGLFWVIVFSVYIAFQVFYAIVRLAVIASQDKDYLRVPKKWPL